MQLAETIAPTSAPGVKVSQNASVTNIVALRHTCTLLNIKWLDGEITLTLEEVYTHH